MVDRLSPLREKPAHPIRLDFPGQAHAAHDAGSKRVMDGSGISIEPCPTRAFSCRIESVGDSRIGLVLIHASGRRRGLACMARSLSVDLRRRVVGAIEGGLSCRAAAQRFGVSASSAIRWRAQERREGDLRPKRQGGDRHSQRIEAHAELILSAVAAKSDMTLAELRERLKERGVAVAIGTLWRFFKRRKITRKKRRRTPPNSAATR
jgi:transposase